MSFKVQIKDYQIIKKASLEFIPGLNVIVGPSNNGKSSILKAIKSLLYTVPGTTSIRFGASSYTVGISYNGHTVILQKGSKEAVYMVDGEKYTKFGTTTPEPVIKSTNIKELTLNGNKEHLNFWEQMEYPFLLDRSPVELFRFIVDSGDDDQITKALKTMVTDRQQISRDIDQMQGSINIVDTEIEDYKAKLEHAEPILEVCDKVIQLQSKVARLNQLKNTREQINALLEQIKDIKLNYSILDKRFKIDSEYESALNDLKNKMDIHKDLFSNMHLTIGDLSDVESSLVEVSNRLTIKIKDTTKLESMKLLKSNLDQIKLKLSSIVIQPVKEFKYDSNIFTRLKDLKALKMNLESLDNQIKKIKIKKVPKLKFKDKDLKTLNSLKTIKQKTDELNYMSKELENSRLLNNTALEVDNDLISLFKICPVCGNKLGDV